MNMFNKLIFVGGFCLFALMLVLVSAQVIVNDNGDNKIVTINDTVFNFTTTPHRTNDNTGFITLNIKTDKRINKTFTFKHNGQREYTIDMNDSSSVSYNTPMFNVDDGCNETLTLDEFNLTLNTVFRTQEISLLNILNLENRAIRTINPNNSIQTAIDNASPGDTIELNGGVYYQHDINVTKANLTIKASSTGGTPIINGEGQERGFNVNSNGVLIQGLTITNIWTYADGGGVYISGSGGSVSGCNFINTTATGSGGGVSISNGFGSSVSGCSFTNTTANADGGGVYINNRFGSVSGCSFTNTTSDGSGGGVYITNVNCSVSGCNFTNTTTTSNYGNGGGVYVSGSGGSVVFNRFVNNTDNGSMVGNGVTCLSSCNVSSNWWGNNTPQNITNGLMDDYYQVELSADQVSMRDLNNSSVNEIVPVPLAYKMCLNGSNNTGNISNLPDFNATIKLNNNLLRSNNNFRSDIGLLRFSPFMSPGDSFDVLAKDPWNDTINNPGNYTFSALVDNQQLNLNLAVSMNTSLSLIATNITYGDNTNITTTLTSSNGTLLTNKNLTFNINGTDYNVTTNELGVAVLNISGLHAGSYNVSA